ncbi:retrovirus-related Pol polyprotein from transposon 297 [Trichonephila clavipes]|uniref:RNA-directed DNA polymerase n=1 Tax=Trichonephila clavipes TaxID=2585209 RepID=A0A8X6V0L8_TRICX|nr:retrovirus-related Pol polyprotein from transposon 297 [Trichonephila clavipes]
MKPPKNNREVSKFLGMTGWYQKFIPRYADICEPLYQLKKKGAKFNWSGEAQDSFDQIKRTLTEAPILQLPNFSEQFNLFTDASGVGIGAVLQQNQKPIAFASRTLNKAERNYTVTERECLVEIWALNKFKTYFGPLPVKSDYRSRSVNEVNQCHRLDIKHMKTVTYRPQSNLTERVNRNLVQMIASFVEENHENWDQFLHEFAFALRTAVNETTNKTPAELFLGRKIITPFSKLINVTEDAKYVGRNIERSFDEARRNMQKKHKSWDKTLQSQKEGCSHQSERFGFTSNTFLKCCSTASKNQALKRSKICKKRSRQGSDHQDRKRHAPEQRQGVKRSIPSSISSRNYKIQKHNTSSPGVESITGPSKLPDRRTATTTSGSRMEVSGRDNQTRQTRATTRRHNEQAEKPVRSNQTNTRRPCPYYLRSRIQEKDRIHEDLNNIEINGIPGSTFRRRSLSMEALNGDPMHRI